MSGDGHIYSSGEQEAALEHAVRDAVESAHPWVAHLPGGTVIASGLTKRDYFAAKAMAAMIVDEHDVPMRGHEGWREEFGREAYRFADAMLAARAEPQS